MGDDKQDHGRAMMGGGDRWERHSGGRVDRLWSDGPWEGVQREALGSDHNDRLPTS